MTFRKLFSCLLVLFCGVSLLTGCSSKSEELETVKETTVELGDPVSLKAEDYLLEKPDQEVLDEIEVDSVLKTDPAYSYNGFSETVTNAGKEYLGIGDYDITLNYQNQKYPVTIHVRDTQMPEFISPAAVVTIPLGTEDYDFSRIYRTDDKDEVTLSVDGDYDVTTVGTYPVTLVAADASGNTNSLGITINVIGSSQPIRANDQAGYETVPPEDSSIEPEAKDPSQSTDNPADTTDPEQTEQPTPTPSCAASKVPAGLKWFYSFSELYQAGTDWNRQDPNNYFYYMEGTDDCGNKIYVLTTGTGTDESVSQPSQPATQEQNS